MYARSLLRNLCSTGLPHHTHARSHTHPFDGPFSGTTQVSRYQTGNPIWILLKQETVSGSGISWAACKSASRSRQTTTPLPHHSAFCRPDALPAAQPTVSKHWMQHTTHTYTHPFNGPFSGTTRVSQHQKGKTSLGFTEARDSEWQWHQLGHMQVCTSLLTDNHASSPPLVFYRPDALPAAQPTASKHWRQRRQHTNKTQTTEGL